MPQLGLGDDVLARPPPTSPPVGNHQCIPHEGACNRLRHWLTQFRSCATRMESRAARPAGSTRVDHGRIIHLYQRGSMQTIQGSVLQSLRAVQLFLDQNAVKLGEVAFCGARKQLDSAIVELTEFAGEQSGSNIAAQGATQKHRLLRDVLTRDHMRPIVRVARAHLPPTPEVEPLKMPQGRPTAARLAELARGMGAAAQPYASVFVDAGMPPNFAEQLDAAADAMLSAVNERMMSRGKRGGATRGLSQSLSRGRRIVHILDAFVQTALKDDASLLASWNIVKRVQRTPGPAKTTEVADIGG